MPWNWRAFEKRYSGVFHIFKKSFAVTSSDKNVCVTRTDFFQIAKSFCVSFIECSDFLISVIKIVIFYFSDFLLFTENLQHLHHKFSVENIKNSMIKKQTSLLVLKHKIWTNLENRVFVYNEKKSITTSHSAGSCSGFSVSGSRFRKHSAWTRRFCVREFLKATWRRSLEFRCIVRQMYAWFHETLPV